MGSLGGPSRLIPWGLAAHLLAAQSAGPPTSQTALETWGPDTGALGVKLPACSVGLGACTTSYVRRLLRAWWLTSLPTSYRPALDPFPCWAISYLPTRRFCHPCVQMWRPSSGISRFVDSRARMGAGQPPTALLCILLLGSFARVPLDASEVNETHTAGQHLLSWT